MRCTVVQFACTIPRSAVVYLGLERKLDELAGLANIAKKWQIM